MNTAKLKKYAPQARREFITAVSKQLNQLGLYSDKQISEVKQEGSVLLIEGKAFEPSVKTARERLVKKVQVMGYNQLVEQVAYTWFNRLCAIRYMEIHDYLGHGFRVLSYPASHPDNSQGAGATNKGRFEIIDHAQDAADELGLDRARIIELKLAGNKDEELYRELLLGQCHKLHEAMPFLFDALDDETELLLPDNLTRTDSILRGLVDSIPEEDWQQVEVIGWLYQFYISEKKDQVIGKVVKSEDIPAATQLFTPNWIVKYLVQNSVGRQWLQTYPDSAIKTQMEYYIEPAEQSDEVNQQLKAITPESIEPETIKVLDPACGSGHILIEAYNVLKAIYEERGFRSRDIPKMILENNLYGLDIDDRAAQLSGFALMMMARDDDKRIFTRNVRLNVLSLQESNHIDLPTLWKALNLSGSWQSGTSQGLFSDEEQDLSSFNADNRYRLLKRTLARFTQAKTFGSLIDVPSDDHEQLKEILSTLVELQESGDSMQKPAAKQLIEFVHQALVLSTRYDAVIANPPYMGNKFYNATLKAYVNENYELSKYDLFTCFIESSLRLNVCGGFSALITIPNWMYLTSFSEFREFIYDKSTICSLINNGRGLWGADFGSCAFVLKAVKSSSYLGSYKKLYDKTSIVGTVESIREQFFKRDPYVRAISAFSRIPTKPLAFWLEDNILDVYREYFILKKVGDTRQGMATSDNDRFLRFWWECDSDRIDTPGKEVSQYSTSSKKWMPYNKGGAYKKWYGNQDYVVNWENNGEEILALAASKYGSPTRTVKSISEYFKPSISWSKVTIGDFSIRYYPSGFIFDVAGCSIFSKTQDDLKRLMGVLNTKFAKDILSLTSQSVNYETGTLANFPINNKVLESDELLALVNKCISLSRELYAIEEYSRDFSKIFMSVESGPIKDSFGALVDYVSDRNSSILDLEFEISQVVSELYGIGFESSKNVSSESITLDEITRKIFSYVIGCIMGRFSIDREGLVYADSVNYGFDILVAEGAYKTFPADEDGIIPLTDQEWFKDDATNRFREFVQVVWGEEHLHENLDFVAESLCLNAIKPKKSESALETIRRYLSTQFYKDHLKTYKKRPIYWLFSSGKQKAFECLVYLHRYNEGTLSRMRTEYVTPLLGKYDAYAEQLEKQIETADSTSEANRFKKELDALIKKQVELREFDDKLKHYADMRISLDLDDGVKVNYGKFGDLLADVKAITGSAPEVN